MNTEIKREREIVKLETVGYSREQAKRLLKKYSCNELYHNAINGEKIKENNDTNIDKLKEVCKKAVKHYGEESRKQLAIEECSELIQALCKDMRGKKHNVEEEIADVLIMINQLFNIYDMEKMDYWLNKKIERLNERMDTSQD